MKRLLLTTTLLAALSSAAHAHGWLLLCPYAPGHQPELERYWQARAYDTAAECETGRDAVEKRCKSDARRKPPTITCNCECWPARGCN
jgi:hypothetical protein